MLESVDFTIDLLSSFELLFHGDKEVNTIDDHLNELNLRETQSISVRDVIDLKSRLKKRNAYFICNLHHPQQRSQHHQHLASGVGAW